MAGGEWLSGWPLCLMLALVALTMAIIWALPKLTTRDSRRRWRGSASPR